MSQRFLSIRNVAIVVSALTIGAAGCGKSEQQQAEEAGKKIEAAAQQMQKGAEQLAKGAEAGSQDFAKGLEKMAQGFQQMTQGNATAVNYEQLKALLPEVNGWTKSDARGEEQNMPVKFSRAEARYRKDQGRIDLEIVDTALSQLLLAPMSMFLATGYSERSDDGFKRATKVGGQPGMEDWNAKSKRGEVTAVVGNRFIVKATGHDVTSLDPVRQAVESVDLAKLAATK